MMNRLLDYAERHAWIVAVAGASLGFGIGRVLHHNAWGWFLIGAGLTLTAIRPVGTGWRRRRMLRQARVLIGQARVLIEAEERERGESDRDE